jgi:hypothetical protein
MRTEEMILEEYRKGGLYERLNLYLQYRDLRCRFTQIDSYERASPQATVSKEKASGGMIGVADCLSRPGNWLSRGKMA